MGTLGPCPLTIPPVSLPSISLTNRDYYRCFITMTADFLVVFIAIVQLS